MKAGQYIQRPKPSDDCRIHVSGDMTTGTPYFCAIARGRRITAFKGTVWRGRGDDIRVDEVTCDAPWPEGQGVTFRDLVSLMPDHWLPVIAMDRGLAGHEARLRLAGRLQGNAPAPK